MSTPDEEAATKADADRYDRMLRLADTFDRAGQELTARARLGEEILGDPDVADSAELSPITWNQAECDIRAATTGKHGLLTRGIELDADALMVRATVLTYRWIDDLQDAAVRTLGAIAGRAIGYLAPEVALGGAIVSAGLIETDALDRDDVAAYLDELVELNPELLEHVTSGGGLLDGLQLRSLLTVGVLAGDTGRIAAGGGLRAVGVQPITADFGEALRDIAGGLTEAAGETDVTAEPSAAAPAPRPPRGLEELVATLAETRAKVRVEAVGPQRYIAYLPGPDGGGGRLRLVGGDPTAYAEHVARALDEAVRGDEDPHVLLVGCNHGGATAAEVACQPDGAAYTIDHVVTAGAPSAAVPRIPPTTSVLSLEDRRDPVALLGSLVNASAPHRLTVVVEKEPGWGAAAYVAGARAVDGSAHPELRGAHEALVRAGYLAG